MLTNKNMFVMIVLALIATPAMGQYQQQRNRGAVSGGVAGAIIGGVVGHQNDETPEGVLIGGAVGALAGSIFGDAQDRHIENSWQRQAQYQQQEAQFRQVQAQQVARAVSINDAISLSQSGVGPSVIVNQIQMNGVQSQLTVNDIITMSRSGVHETVINAMQNGRIAGAPVQYAAPIYSPRPAPIVVEHYNVIRPMPAPRQAFHFDYYHHNGHHDHH